MVANQDALNVAPSEEFVLHCDASGCTAALSTIAGVSRHEHGWGRISIYLNPTGATADYDLCPAHYNKILDDLRSGR